MAPMKSISTPDGSIKVGVNCQPDSKSNLPDKLSETTVRGVVMTKIILFLVFGYPAGIERYNNILCIFKWYGHYQFHAGGRGTSPNGERSVVSNSTLLDRGCGPVIVNNN